jgi:2-haloacid dehalogenase
LRAITGDYTDFWQVTQDGLDFAMAALSLEGEAEMRERLLALYWELQAYEEVPEMLAKLKEQGFITAILSNGSPDMLNGAVQSAGLEELLDDVLSVESVGIFKPSAKVYDLVGQKLGVASSEVLFVSSNGWDAAGACRYGFQTVWVNRAGDPMDNLPAKPNFELDDLTLIPDLAAR